MEELRGKITHRKSGISILLPIDWSATPDSDGQYFYMGSDNELGVLTFEVQSIASYVSEEKDDLPKAEFKLKSVRHKGGYEIQFYHMPRGIRNRLKIWTRKTDHWVIRFLYGYHHSYRQELKAVAQIITTLVIPAGSFN